MTNSLNPFFHPQGIAIVGASSHPEKLGYGVARNLFKSGYGGAVHLVNPKGGKIFDREMVKSIAEIPNPVDLAVLVIPPKYAPDTMRACGERGIKATILVSGGFRETGEEGAKLENETIKVAREYGIRMIGPNCIGLIDTHLPLDTTFLPLDMPQAGQIAFISHSGAICDALIDWSKGQGFGFSRIISIGNQADVNETDLLPLVAEDEHTKVITLYLENVNDGECFIKNTRKIVAEKPIVVLKTGRSESGQRAAASHTGALAGADTAYTAAFEKAGVFRADTTEEIFDWARALAWSPLPQGGRVGVLSNAGGLCVVTADALDREGLLLTDFTNKTTQALDDFLVPAASTQNPVDMLAGATAKDYAKALRLLLADTNTDSVLVLIPPPPMYPAEEVADEIIPVIQQAKKPVLVVLVGSEHIEEASRRFQKAKIPEYRFPERATSALARLTERAEFLREIEIDVLTSTSPDLTNIRAALADAPSGSWLDPELAERLMSIYEIPTSPIKLAPSAEVASEIATELGFPIAMKIASPDIPHKSDVDGILLNLASAQEVLDSYEMLMKGVQAQRPRAKLEGVHLQKMIPVGQEVIVGAVRDPQFGALMMFGSGGVEVEGLKDVAFAIAPLSVKEAEKMIGKTWAGKKLDGYRNLPAVDKTALIDALSKLSQLAHDLPEIAEIEINPLTVLQEGVVAVDVRVKMP
ncbi:MAG: CoA-binding protein [Anaerolineae bacterium]|jgi:acetate---CoA ligase (ADP-forming)|nr:CoA-binding protein [Anaerolineae bacterium]